MTIWIPILWMATGVCLFAGLHFLTIGHSKGNARLFTAFGVMSLLVGAYIGVSAMLQTPDLSLPWLQLERAHMAVACAIYPVGIWFIALFSRLRHWRRWVVIGCVVFGAALVADSVQPGSLLLAGARPAPDLVLPWGEHIQQVVSTPAPTALAYDIANLLVFVWAFWRCMALVRQGDWPRTRALLAYLIPQLIASVYSEYASLHSALGVSGLDWSALPFLLLVVVVSTTLSLELRRNAVALDASVAALHTENDRRAEAEARLRHMAYTDARSGLPNRHALDDWLAARLAAAPEARGVLFVIDPGRFAVINHAFGRHAADQLLAEIGVRLRGAVGHAGYVARLDGDELAAVAMISDPAADAAARLAARLRDALATPSEVIAGQALSLTTHIGFAPLQADTDTLLRHAYAALQAAKESGHDAPVAFAASMASVAARRAQLEADLRAAIAQRQLSLVYQPQADRTGRLVGAEALLRWQHPEFGAVSPTEFVGIAEHSGQMAVLGHFVLETACAVLASLPVDDVFRLAVNISAQQLWQPDFLDTVRRAVTSAAVDPHRLTLEITESVFIRDLPDAATKIDVLNRMGVRVSVDDFGTGHASIASLKSFAVGELKIDQSFVRDMSIAQPDRFVVAMIALGRALDLNTVAEGVERDDQKQALLQLGCDTLQGYLIGACIDAAELARQLQAQAAVSA